MYPKNYKQRVLEAMLLLLVLSFVAHLMWDWLSQIVPLLLAIAALAVIYRLVFRGWQR
jgi:hypothetical protein